VPEAIRRCEELRDGVRDDAEVRAAIASTLAGLHAMQGDFDEARQLAEEGRVVYEELGLRYMRAARSLASGSIELLAGDPAAAVRELRWGYDALEKMGERGTRSTLAAFLAQALVEHGQYADAIEFSKISEEMGATADVVTQAVWRNARAAAQSRRFRRSPWRSGPRGFGFPRRRRQNRGQPPLPWRPRWKRPRPARTGPAHRVQLQRTADYC
jgi:ATP/maltotriose-dependent transcriptional regulator MalT